MISYTSDIWASSQVYLLLHWIMNDVDDYDDDLTIPWSLPYYSDFQLQKLPIKKVKALQYRALYDGNPPMVSWFSSQWDSYVERVAMPLCHHAVKASIWLTYIWSYDEWENRQKCCY